MFTGLVEELGRVRRVERRGEFQRLEIAASTVLSDLAVGDSVNIDGVCQTAVAIADPRTWAAVVAVCNARVSPAVNAVASSAVPIRSMSPLVSESSIESGCASADSAINVRMPVRDAIASRMGDSGCVVFDRVCPSSPAVPRGPWNRRSYSTMPPPMPVPTQAATMHCAPRPAPRRYSPQAAAFTSFSRTTGRPSRWLNGAESGTSVQSNAPVRSTMPAS